MNNYFKVKEYWLGVDFGNRIFFKRKFDILKFYFLFVNFICDFKYMYYCNVKINIYNFCKGVFVVIFFIVLKVCFEW